MLMRLVGATFDGLGYVVEEAGHWAGAAHRALTFILVSILLLTFGGVAVGVLLSWLMESVTPLLWMMPLYAVATLVLAFMRPAAHAAILLFALDILKLRVMGRMHFHSYTHEHGVFEYLGQDFLGDLSILKTAGKILWWMVAVEFLTLLLFAVFPVWIFPAVPAFLMAGLLIHVLFSVQGIQGVIKSSLVWSLIALGITINVLGHSGWINDKYGDAAYANKQAQTDARFESALREDIDQNLADARIQIVGYQAKINNGTITAAEMVEFDKWVKRADDLQKKGADPIPRPKQAESPKPDGTAAAATAGTSAGGDNKPPTAGSSSNSGLLQGMTRTFDGMREWMFGWFMGVYSSTGTPIALLITLALLACLFYVFIWYGVVALWKHYSKSTEGMTPDELKKHKETRKLAFGRTFWMPVFAVLALMFLLPALAGIETWTREGGAQRALKDLDTPNAGRVAAASTLPVTTERPARRNNPVDGRVVLMEGRITDQQLRASSLIDTGFIANQPFEILISRNTVQNGYSLPCGFDGCTAQQVDGVLLCPDKPHMMLVAQIGDGIKYVIKQASAFRGDKLPEDAQTLKLGVNQALDEWARKNQNGGFEFTIVAAR